MVTAKKFDVANHLDTPETIAFYLTEAFESEDSKYIRLALGTVARTKSVAAGAEKVGLSPADLSKSQDLHTPLKFDAVHKLLGAAGVKLVAKPIEPA